MARFYVMTFNGPRILESIRYSSVLSNDYGGWSTPSQPIFYNEDGSNLENGLNMLMDTEDVLDNMAVFEDVQLSDKISLITTVRFADIDRNVPVGLKFTARVRDTGGIKTKDVPLFNYLMFDLPTTYDATYEDDLGLVESLPRFTEGQTNRMVVYNTPLNVYDRSEGNVGYSYILMNYTFENGSYNLQVIFFTNGSAPVDLQDLSISSIYSFFTEKSSNFVHDDCYILGNAEMMAVGGLSIFIDGLSSALKSINATNSDYVKV